MRFRALAVPAAALALAACAHHATRSKQDRASLSPEEQARYDCRVAFTACAPEASYRPDLDVSRVDVRTLVQLAWRLDLDDGLSEEAGKRLRRLAERGDVGTVREIATAAEAAAATLGRCRCKDDALRPEYETQRIGTVVAGRLPPPELGDPSFWARRVDPHLTALRALSRRSAEALAIGDAAGNAAAEAEARREERDLCEVVHAARDALPQGGMEDLRDLVSKGPERDSGEASADAARRAFDRAEARRSCAEQDAD